MAENIIDIIHRLSYDVDNTDIRATTTEIDKNIQAVKKLEEENKKLAVQIKNTSVHDVTQKTKLQLAWRDNQQEIERLKKSVSGLNKVAAPASKSMSKMGESTSQAANTLRAFSYIARDAPYGIIGITNNITELADNFGYLKKATGSSGAAFKALMKSFIGPAGIGIGISIVTSLIVSLVRKYGSLDNAMKELFGTTTDLERAQKNLNDAIGDGAKEITSNISKLLQIQATIDLAGKGYISAHDAVDQFNKSLGDSLGKVNSLKDAQDKLNQSSEAYIKATVYKTVATSLFNKAAEEITDNIAEQAKSDEEAAKFWDKTANIFQLLFTGENKSGKNIFSAWSKDLKDLNEESGSARKRLSQLITQNDFAKLTAQAQKYFQFAAELAKQFKLDIFGTSGSSDKNGNKTGDKTKNRFALPFLSSVDETAIKDYRDKLKETLAIFDAHWADYKAKAAEEYKNGVISKKEFDDKMLALEALRLNKVKELLDKFAKEHPYVQFFKDQQTDINKQLAPIINDLRIKLPDKAALAPMGQAWKDYADKQKKAADDAAAAADDGKKNIIKWATAYQVLSNAAIGAFQDILRAHEQSTEQQLQIEQTRVERAQKIADRGNAEALQKETEKQNKLQQQHERQVKAEVALNSIMTESNAIAAVVRAAADPVGGGILAPATIALVIAAIAGGIVAVENIAKDAPGFKEGIVDLQGPGTTKSDSIPARLSKHESIMTAEATENNKELLERMNRGEKIRAGIEAATMRPMALPVHKPFDVSPAVINYGNQDKINRHILSELKAIKQTIANKKEYGISIDRRGIYATVTEFQQQTERRKKL